jgi:hypothetical protein
LALSWFVEPRSALPSPEVAGAPLAALSAESPRAPRDCRAGVVEEDADEESAAVTLVSDGVPVSAAAAGKPVIAPPTLIPTPRNTARAPTLPT